MVQRIGFWLALLSGVASMPLTSQPPPPATLAANHDAQSEAGAAADACEALSGLQIGANEVGLPTRGATITSTRLYPAGSPDVTEIGGPAAARVNAGTQAKFGEFCLVQGVILTVQPGAQNINFDVALPTAWNGKSVHLGGGGLNGWLVPATMSPGGKLLTPPLARGYVTFGSDSGHSGSLADPTFMLNAVELQNFASDQLKKTHDVAVRLMKARYGSAPKLSYFMGASEGGREALTVVQDYPDDYDAVIAVYPYISPIPSILKSLRITQAMRSHQGKGWLDTAKLELVRAKVLSSCDLQDGISDGLVSNIAMCRPNLQTLRCPNGGESGPACLSDAQLATLGAIHSTDPLSYSLAHGNRSLRGYPFGADWSLNGYSPTMPATTDEMPFANALPNKMVRNLIFEDPALSTDGFDALLPGKYLAQIQRMSQLLDKTGPNIDRFRARGGKLIIVQGLADVSAHANNTIGYYRSLEARYGASNVSRTVQLYLIPGWGHGSGISFNAANAPFVDWLEAWRERGTLPREGQVTDVNPAAKSRTRPLCRYPSWPKYVSGSVDDAKSFRCSR